jgi:hypothetical protein
VTRVTQCLLLLLGMLAGGAHAQQGPSVILGSGILYFTEAGPPVWVSGPTRPHYTHSATHTHMFPLFSAWPR